MKTLEIKVSFSEYHEKHHIYLGNNEFLKSHNKTFIKKYLRVYKKVLMDNVRQLNLNNSLIYQLYRNFFFDLSDTEVRQITQLNELFNESFNWMFDNIGGCQNSIIFSKINRCIISQIQLLNILKNHGLRHKNYALKNQSIALLKMLNDFETNFQNDKISLDLDRDYTKDNLKLIKEEIKNAS